VCWENSKIRKPRNIFLVSKHFSCSLHFS
jgi:hypothetical protein